MIMNKFRRWNKGVVILINGISASGKTTIALGLKNFLEKQENRNVQIIDGDISRDFFGNDLGYSEEERFNAFKRNIFGAYLLSNQGVDVILSIMVSRNEFREFMRNKLDFIEIFLDADIEDCIKNDPKGVYKKVMQFDNPHMPGLDIPFQKPENPDLILNPYKEKPEESLDKITRFLRGSKKLNKEIKTIVYSGTLGDLLFHYGHLKSLKFASSLGDYYVCGVLTSEAAKTYRNEPLVELDKRKFLIEHLNFVDRVMIQDSKDSTENLKKLHEEFKDAKIILVRSDSWEGFPEKEFLDNINGEIVIHSYTKEISDFKIMNYILKCYKGKFKDFDDFTNYFKVKDFIEFGKEIKPTVISTKANTLKTLQPLLKNSSIEKTFVFTVFDWKNKKEELINSIKENFSSDKIVIRSSALIEDTSDSSMAGYFHSELNVPSDDFIKIGNSIEIVVSSYNNKNSNDNLNQILVQKQTENIKLSGVVFTQNLENNAPYYVINYDDYSGSTETVTKGLENKNIKISKFCDPKDYPNNLYKLLIAIKEIEDIIPDMPLDIEFAVNNKDQVIIFQVRPIVTKRIKEEYDEGQIKNKINELKSKFSFLSKKQPHLSGDYTFFGDMPDWNPAEIIGNNPNFLDYSLYDYIITDSVWHESRASQGYYNVNPAKLVVLFGNKPYVNIRNSFNSFIPNSLSDNLREKLINFYLNKLNKNPELQDKVEFEILYTCYDLSFDKKSNELMENGFTQEEILELKKSLINITNNLLVNFDKFVENDLNCINKMESIRQEIINSKGNETKRVLQTAIKLLNNCRQNGTIQFSRLARLAFIGKIILKSMVDQEVVDKKFCDSFLESVNTVAKSMNKDFSYLINGKLSKKDFINKYGHLRPGTYDITSKRYDKNEILFENISLSNILEESNLELTVDENTKNKIDEALKKDGNININSEYLLNFIKCSLEARELSKFEFTKSLSDAIELIAESGKNLGISREDMSFLNVESLIKFINLNKEDKSFFKGIIDSRKEERQLNSFLILPPIIFSERDFDIISYYTAKPNFITQKRVNGEIINLNNAKEKNKYNLKDKIVVLENGDPGYDWIFTKNIAGLITKYGGVASHMSIRCSEFGIPAAIGCGDLIFDKFSISKNIDLNCETEKIEFF